MSCECSHHVAAIFSCCEPKDWIPLLHKPPPWQGQGFVPFADSSLMLFSDALGRALLKFTTVFKSTALCPTVPSRNQKCPNLFQLIAIAERSCPRSPYTIFRSSIDQAEGMREKSRCGHHFDDRTSPWVNWECCDRKDAHVGVCQRCSASASESDQSLEKIVHLWRVYTAKLLVDKSYHSNLGG